MLDDNRSIIADLRSGPGRPVMIGIFLAAIVIGTLAAGYYAAAGLTLSHYDARAHLVVARRIVDSLTPGWKQIGGVWLPLPHLLQFPVVQWDWAYRTGYPSTAISVLALAVGLAALSATLWRLTASRAAAVASPLIILLNPNVLYLQSTPMTEPLLIGLSLLSAWLVVRWLDHGDQASCRNAGCAIVALALTRYEGWLVAGALVGLAAVGRRRDGPVRALALAPYLGGAIVGFLLLSKGATDQWFVTSGFFDVDTESLNAWLPSFARVYRGVYDLGGTVLLTGGLVGATIAGRRLVRGDLVGGLLLALLAAALLPLYAFYQGHPFRIRYMVPVVVALGALSGLAIAAFPRRTQWMAAGAFAGAVLWQCPSLDSRAPMLLEAQWEAPLREGRAQVTRYLLDEWDGTPILASMGSLAHYMQEASHAGFVLADFVHEGNGELWRAAHQEPGRYVRWILTEEQSEGGDLVAVHARTNDSLLSGWERVAEGGGTALYRLR